MHRDSTGRPFVAILSFSFPALFGHFGTNFVAKLQCRERNVSMSCPMNKNELMLYRVLQRANLIQYYDVFISQGGDDVNQLCEAGEEEFLEIMALVGMASKPLHVRRLQKALHEWVTCPAKFQDPVRDRQSLMTAPPPKGSIFACLTTQRPPNHIVPAHKTPPTKPTDQFNPVTPRNGNDTSSYSSGHIPDHSRGYKLVNDSPIPDSVAHRTLSPNSDVSDPDGSTASFTYSIDRTVSPSACGGLTDEQIKVLTTAAEEMAKTLPHYAPKPLNMKKPTDKDIDEVMNLADGDPNQMELLRKYSAIYGRFDSKRRNDKLMNFHEMCVNEAAAQLCKQRPSLLSRREDLFPLARQVVRDSGLQYLKGQPHRLVNQEEAPPIKILKVESPLSLKIKISPKHKFLQPTTVSLDASQETVHQEGSSVAALNSDRPVLSPGDVSTPQSLVDEGIRIARTYGLGAFEEQLKELKQEPESDEFPNVENSENPNELCDVDGGQLKLAT